VEILLVTTWQCGLFADSFSYHGDWTLVRANNVAWRMWRKEQVSEEHAA